MTGRRRRRFGRQRRSCGSVTPSGPADCCWSPSKARRKSSGRARYRASASAAMWIAMPAEAPFCASCAWQQSRTSPGTRWSSPPAAQWYSAGENITSRLRKICRCWNGFGRHGIRRERQKQSCMYWCGERSGLRYDGTGKRNGYGAGKQVC